MDNFEALPMFLNPKLSYSQRAIPWWFQKQLIHGVLSADSQTDFLGLHSSVIHLGQLQIRSSCISRNEFYSLHLQQCQGMCLASLYPRI